MQWQPHVQLEHTVTCRGWQTAQSALRARQDSTAVRQALMRPRAFAMLDSSVAVVQLLPSRLTAVRLVTNVLNFYS